ncbi:MAG: hypothetical protein AW07_00122 [Candidatus Accumulibacter sp. SK-11]|nr:MAG: hypothetical protein AW07_00122 [Candidatus Accumulibacter sp. SK-11]
MRPDRGLAGSIVGRLRDSTTNQGPQSPCFAPKIEMSPA